MAFQLSGGDSGLIFYDSLHLHSSASLFIMIDGWRLKQRDCYGVVKKGAADGSKSSGMMRQVFRCKSE